MERGTEADCGVCFCSVWMASMPHTRDSATAAPKLDAESATWIARLQPNGEGYEVGVRDLHVLLLKAARFEVRRRCSALGEMSDGDHEDLAHQSADDALVAVLRKLGDFRGESRFTTWAYKFALLEAAVKVRRRVWQGREVRLEPEGWSAIADRTQGPHEDAEKRELIEALQQAIANDLSVHQREVLVAITLNGVPIDVLAERLGTTRGALYKSLHDARAKLRTTLVARGLDVDRQLETSPS
jgi:RNA polymerase sigma-70 factor, ECF subfamily